MEMTQTENNEQRTTNKKNLIEILFIPAEPISMKNVTESF